MDSFVPWACRLKIGFVRLRRVLGRVVMLFALSDVCSAVGVALLVNSLVTGHIQLGLVQAGTLWCLCPHSHCGCMEVSCQAVGQWSPDSHCEWKLTALSAECS